MLLFSCFPITPSYSISYENGISTIVRIIKSTEIQRMRSWNKFRDTIGDSRRKRRGGGGRSGGWARKTPLEEENRRKLIKSKVHAAQGSREGEEEEEDFESKGIKCTLPGGLRSIVMISRH